MQCITVGIAHVQAVHQRPNGTASSKRFFVNAHFFPKQHSWSSTLFLRSKRLHHHIQNQYRTNVGPQPTSPHTVYPRLVAPQQTFVSPNSKSVDRRIAIVHAISSQSVGPQPVDPTLTLPTRICITRSQIRKRAAEGPLNKGLHHNNPKSASSCH